MDEQDLVTVVIPVHNGESFLDENVKCILNQTYNNLEIIYVCDGCIDRTIEILEKYASFDFRIKVCINIRKQGAARSRNIGKEIAKGEWIIFLDSDDVFELNMIEKMLTLAISENADMCCCFWEEFVKKPVLGSYIPNTALKRYCETYPVIDVLKEKKYILQLALHAPWNKLIHKTVYQKENVFFQDLPNCDDAYFSFIASAEAIKIVYLDEVLVHYRSCKGRNSLSTEQKYKKNYVWEAYDKLYRYIMDKEDNKELKQSFYNRVCDAIPNLIGNALYVDLYYDLHSIYLEKWGMHNKDISEELSYFNREVYLGLQTEIPFVDENLLRIRAKEKFICDMAKKRKCSIWGCGNLGCQILNRLDFVNVDIQHIFDSDSRKWGLEIAGKFVEEFKEEWVDCIIVTSPQHYGEIKNIIGNRAGSVYDLEKEIFLY